MNEILALDIVFKYKIWNLQKRKSWKEIAPITFCKFRVAVVSPFSNGTLRENDFAITYAGISPTLRSRFSERNLGRRDYLLADT